MLAELSQNIGLAGRGAASTVPCLYRPGAHAYVGMAGAMSKSPVL